ncbi:hypothetical protein FQA39_LY04106 [Lamprigera yunnana]|nr:hypothetical protein FQA39_LY04106 [Lamprigera yunnana]
MKNNEATVESLPYFAKQTTVLKIFGISLTGNEGKAYRFYSTLLLVITIVLHPFLGLREMFVHGIEVYLDYMVYEFAYFMVLAKIAVTYNNRIKLGKILRRLHEKPFLPDTERGGTKEKILLDECQWITNAQILVYWGMAFSTVAATILYTLIIRISSNDYHDWVLTYGPLSVLNITSSPNYEITLFYQNFSMSCCTILFTATDLLIASVLAHISYQFQILQNYMRRLVKDTYTTDFKGDESLGITVKTTLIPWELLRKKQSQFIKYHIEIIDIARKMEEAFSVLLLLVYLGTIGLLCFEIYRGSMVTNYMQLVRTFGEIISFLVQIGTLSFWGEQVILQSEAVSNAAYETDFVGSDLRFQKGLLMIMCRSQRAVKLTAGKFAIIQLFTFTWGMENLSSTPILVAHVHSRTSYLQMCFEKIKWNTCVHFAMYVIKAACDQVTEKGIDLLVVVLASATLSVSNNATVHARSLSGTVKFVFRIIIG